MANKFEMIFFPFALRLIFDSIESSIGYFFLSFYVFVFVMLPFNLFILIVVF